MLDDQFIIKTKNDLKYYLECDKASLMIEKEKPSINPYKDKIWKFQILLRKTEFWSNQKSKFSKIPFIYYKIKLSRIMEKRCLEIPLNCIREGLVIWHCQNIIMTSKIKVGKNFSVSAGTVIGQEKRKYPIIGDNVTMTVGSKVLGANVADNVTIGASALVIKDIDESFTTWGGIPAKKISNNFQNISGVRADKIKEIEKKYRIYH